MPVFIKNKVDNWLVLPRLVKMGETCYIPGKKNGVLQSSHPGNFGFISSGIPTDRVA